MTRRIKDAPVGTYLSHLKSVSVNADYARMPGAGSSIAFLMSLPSLTSCHMSNLVLGYEEGDLEWHLRPRESNVSDLTFATCYVGKEALLKLLESITCLRSFTCIDLYIRSAFLANSWYGLYLSLLGSSSSSLEKLTLTTNYDDVDLGTNTYNLRGFEVLREIEIDLSLILNDSGPSVQDFPKMLPSSLRMMRLRSIPTSSRSEAATQERFPRIREAILSVLEAKDVLLPQLTEV